MYQQHQYPNQHYHHQQEYQQQQQQQQYNQIHPSIEMQQSNHAETANMVQYGHQQNHVLQQEATFGYDVNYGQTIQQAPLVYYPMLRSFKAIIGDFKVPLMINYCSYLAAFAILITYIVACSLGHQEWFPCMITSAGTDYPENIFFRIGLLTTIFYWIIMILFQYWWLKAESEALLGVVKVSSKMNLIAFVGFFFYGLTIATIDDGHIPTQFHGLCAVIFFVLLCIYTQWNFQVVRSIRNLNPAFMTNSSYDRKKFFAFAWLAVLFFLILLALKFKWGLAVAEWIGTYSIIFYLQTFATDLKNFYLDVDDQQFTKQDMKVQLARNLEEQRLHSKQVQNQVQQQTYPLLNANNQPQHVVVIPSAQFNHQVPAIHNQINHRPHVVNHENAHVYHSQPFFQPRVDKQQQTATQSHFQPNRANVVNSSETTSTIDNSFMSIKKPFFTNGQN